MEWIFVKINKMIISSLETGINPSLKSECGSVCGNINTFVQERPFCFAKSRDTECPGQHEENT
jgi:hypothetical protein